MSKTKKTTFKAFDYMHCDGFARYLERMAAKGWYFKEWGAGLAFRNEVGDYYVRYENAILIFYEDRDYALEPGQIAIIRDKLELR